MTEAIGQALDAADPRLVGVYLNDHLAGSVAGSRRFELTAETLRRTPVGPRIAEIAREVAEEREELRDIIVQLDAATQNVAKQALAWTGERLARLKASPRQVRRSPMRTLLEVELLRSALVGKLGVWQVLEDLGDGLGLDVPRMRELRLRTVRQIATMDAVHEYVRVRALVVKGL
jgi:hypothetical protein